MLWSFSSKDYRTIRGDRPHTNSFKAFLNSQNYWDFIRDTGLALKFYFDSALGKSHQYSPNQYDTAFGVNGASISPSFEMRASSLDALPKGEAKSKWNRTAR